MPPPEPPLIPALWWMDRYTSALARLAAATRWDRVTSRLPVTSSTRIVRKSYPARMASSLSATRRFRVHSRVSPGSMLLRHRFPGVPM